jgi:hypothetical protein
VTVRPEPKGCATQVADRWSNQCLKFLDQQEQHQKQVRGLEALISSTGDSSDTVKISWFIFSPGCSHRQSEGRFPLIFPSH